MSVLAESLAGSRPRTPAGRAVAALNHAVIHIVLGLIGLIWLVPTIGLLVTSFRPRSDIQATGWWDIFELHFTLDNYRQVLEAQGMLQAFMNTVFIAVPSTLLPLGIGALAAYAFSWIRFPFRDTLFLIVTAFLLVPVQVAFIPLLTMSRDLLPDLQLTSWSDGERESEPLGPHYQEASWFLRYFLDRVGEEREGERCRAVAERPRHRRAEARVAGRDAEIAGERHEQPAADGVALDHGDGGLGHRVDAPEHAGDARLVVECVLARGELEELRLAVQNLQIHGLQHLFRIIAIPPAASESPAEARGMKPLEGAFHLGPVHSAHDISRSNRQFI